MKGRPAKCPLPQFRLHQLSAQSVAQVKMALEQHLQHAKAMPNRVLCSTSSPAGIKCTTIEVSAQQESY